MAKAPSNEVAIPDATGTGLAGLDPEMLAAMEGLKNEALQAIDMSADVRLPGLILTQGMSQHDAKTGELFHTLTGEKFDRAAVLIFRVAKARTLFGKKIGDPPLCSSPDSISGYGSIGDELEKRSPSGGGYCLSCPEARIPDGRCKLSYNYIAVLLGDPDLEETDREIEFDMPVGISMKSTSARTGVNLNSLLMSMRFPWSNVINLSSEGKENDQGKFAVWTMSKGRPATQREILRAFELAQQLSKATSITVDDHDVQDAPTSAAATPSSGKSDDEFGF